MSKQYRLVVFDWEGTLGDTLGDIFAIVSEIAERHHFGKLDKQKARQYFHLDLNVTISKLFPHLSPDQQKQFLTEIHNVWHKTRDKVCLMPDALAVIKHLQQAGIYLAIATNKGKSALQAVLQSTGLDSYFPIFRCADEVPAKPCPQMLEEIMEEVAVEPEETLMIGDSTVDIEMAKHAGVDSIGVDFYHQHAQGLLDAGALQVIDNYHELLEFLKIKR